MTASVVLQRHVADHRPPRRPRDRPPGAQRPPPVQWIYEYDEGVDPADPAVQAAAAEALEAARADVGLTDRSDPSIFHYADADC